MYLYISLTELRFCMHTITGSYKSDIQEMKMEKGRVGRREGEKNRGERKHLKIITRKD